MFNAMRLCVSNRAGKEKRDCTARTPAATTKPAVARGTAGLVSGPQIGTSIGVVAHAALRAICGRFSSSMVAAAVFEIGMW